MTDIAATESAATRPGKGLHVALWVVQVLLALAFGMAGVMKSTAPIEELATKMTWVNRHPGLVRFIGVTELAGAIGLILPAATRILPVLTPAAALGFVTVMVLAMGDHLMAGEAPMLLTNVVLGGLAGFVAWGRLKKAPIAKR